MHLVKNSFKRFNERAGGDGGVSSLLHAERLWPAAPQHERSAKHHR